jgi:penicillin-binding protein 2
MRDDIKKYKKFSRRSLIINSLKLTIFTGLISRFFYLQILNAKKFKTLSINNKLRISYIPALRGQILSAENILIATNKVKHSLYILKNSNKLSRTVDILNKIIGPQKIKLEENNSTSNKYKGTKAIKLIDDIAPKYIRMLRANPKLNNVIVAKEYVRYYPFGSLLFHILGYTRTTQNLIKHQGQNIIGYNGIEKKFDNELSGTAGIEKKEVNARGKFIRTIDIINPKFGQNINLSVNIDIQKLIQNAMQDKVGTILVYDLLDTSIAALYSSPTVNANLFTKELAKKDWQKVAYNKQNPFINRAISALYNPGSTFKIILYLAILVYNIKPDETISCPGYFKFGNRTYHCHKKSGHGPVKLDQALSESCNVYFYNKSLQLGIKRIKNIANKLGLGMKTNIELSGELAGLIPDHQWKAARFSKSWYMGDTINSSIGQGYVQTTAIQLLKLISQIALNQEIEMSLLPQNKKLTTEKLFPEAYIDRLKAALQKSIRSNQQDHLKIIGKTGTSQVVSREHHKTKLKHQDHSIFIGYTQYKNKQYAISLVVEHGGWGSKTALPLAKQILTEIQNL